MRRISLATVVAACDRLLRTGEIVDFAGAVNGLQVENRRGVSRIAAAVDANLLTVRTAAERGADLLLVHHGIFWNPHRPWTGGRAELLRTLISNDLALYSSHLPLDLHRRLGNNAQLCRSLGLGTVAPFFAYKNQKIGLYARTALARTALVRRLEKVVGGRVTVIPAGPARCARVGIVTGGAGAELAQAAAEGIDTFVTGEGPHWTYSLAYELGVNVLYGGHYATEIFGVKALAAHLAQRFGLPWEFLDCPSGL